MPVSKQRKNHKKKSAARINRMKAEAKSFTKKFLAAMREKQNQVNNSETTE
jgi:hypothetical protein